MAFFEGSGSAAGTTAFKALKGLASSSGLAIFLAISGGAATTPMPAQAQTYSFNKVEIEGTQRIEAATILSYLGIVQGQAVSAAQLNDGYQRLVGSGLFEDVKVIPRGNVLVVQVREYPTINVVSVEGNRKVKDEVFADLLKSQPRRVFSPATAEEDVQTIVEVYQSQGRLAARVTPKIIRRANNRVDLVFEVVEGKNTEVERLSFVGNRKFSDARLRRVLETKQAGLLRALIQKKTPMFPSGSSLISGFCQISISRADMWISRSPVRPASFRESVMPSLSRSRFRKVSSSVLEKSRLFLKLRV